MTTVRPSSRFASTRSFWTVHISARTVWRHGEQRTESTNLAIGPQRGRRRKTRRMKIDYMRRCLPLRCRRNRHQQSYAQLPSGSWHGFAASMKLVHSDIFGAIHQHITQDNIKVIIKDRNITSHHTRHHNTRLNTFPPEKNKELINSRGPSLAEI